MSATSFVFEPSTRALDVARYGLALVVVIALGLAGIILASRSTLVEAASEIDSAVLIDLPPAEAPSQPASDAAEGPLQQPTRASVSQQAPQEIQPPKDPKPVEDAKLEPETKPVAEPPPVMPDPAAVLERKQDAAPPPKPLTAPATQAQEERAPTGADAATKTTVEDDEDGRPHASALAITLWQKSMMRRLEAAKRQVGREPHPAGTVKIAFAISPRGALASERVLMSSGSAALDRAALLLVRQAAPFPAPPPESGGHDTSFVVPVRFR